MDSKRYLDKDMNLEKFLDEEMHKQTIDVEINFEDGSPHRDPNYTDYDVVDVRYVQTAYITVRKKTSAKK